MSAPNRSRWRQAQPIRCVECQQLFSSFSAYSLHLDGKLCVPIAKLPERGLTSGSDAVWRKAGTGAAS